MRTIQLTPHWINDQRATMKEVTGMYHPAPIAVMYAQRPWKKDFDTLISVEVDGMGFSSIERPLSPGADDGYDSIVDTEHGARQPNVSYMMDRPLRRVQSEQVRRLAQDDGRVADSAKSLLNVPEMTKRQSIRRRVSRLLDEGEKRETNLITFGLEPISALEERKSQKTDDSIGVDFSENMSAASEQNGSIISFLEAASEATILCDCNQGELKDRDDNDSFTVDDDGSRDSTASTRDSSSDGSTGQPKARNMMIGHDTRTSSNKSKSEYEAPAQFAESCNGKSWQYHNNEAVSQKDTGMKRESSLLRWRSVDIGRNKQGDIPAFVSRATRLPNRKVPMVISRGQSEPLGRPSSLREEEDSVKHIWLSSSAKPTEQHTTLREEAWSISDSNSLELRPSDAVTNPVSSSSKTQTRTSVEIKSVSHDQGTAVEVSQHVRESNGSENFTLTIAKSEIKPQRRFPFWPGFGHKAMRARRFKGKAMLPWKRRVPFMPLYNAIQEECEDKATLDSVTTPSEDHDTSFHSSTSGGPSLHLQQQSPMAHKNEFAVNTMMYVSEQPHDVSARERRLLMTSNDPPELERERVLLQAASYNLSDLAQDVKMKILQRLGEEPAPVSTARSRSETYSSPAHHVHDQGSTWPGHSRFNDRYSASINDFEGLAMGGDDDGSRASSRFSLFPRDWKLGECRGADQDLGGDVNTTTSTNTTTSSLLHMANILATDQDDDDDDTAAKRFSSTSSLRLIAPPAFR